MPRRMVAALQATGSQKDPVNAARAQVMFDCWMQEQEENRQADDIAACRDGFIDAIGQVEAALKPMMAPKVAKAAPAKAMAAPKPDAMNWVTYYAFDTAKISDAAMQIIAEAAAYSTKFARPKVTVTGHTDLAGAADYNQSLSEMRADDVALAIMGQGVAANDVRIRALGQTEPAVQTPDGQREQANRRVTITVDSK